MCTIGNSSLFKSKNTEPYKYPEKPYLSNKKDVSEQMNENEKAKKRQELFAKLNIMAANYNLSKS